jgi:RimJ/RimL family protein N-acetyltransferase
MIITETPRLFLRHFHVEDIDTMAALFGDPEVMQFGSGVRNREWVEQWLQGCLEDYFRKLGFGLWAVVLREDGVVAGYCGLSRFGDVDGRSEVEIGFRLSRRYWGQGIASEAACAVRDYGFDILNLRRLVSIIDPKNVASLRVAEKVGMHYEKQIQFREKVVALYSIARESVA